MQLHIATHPRHVLLTVKGQHNKFLQLKTCAHKNWLIYRYTLVISTISECPYRTDKPWSTVTNFTNPLQRHFWNTCSISGSDFCTVGAKPTSPEQWSHVFSPSPDVALCPSKQPIPNLLVASNHNKGLHLNAVLVLWVLNGSKRSNEHQTKLSTALRLNAQFNKTIPCFPFLWKASYGFNLLL